MYADPDGEEGEEPPAPVVAPRIEPSAAEMAAAAAGQQVGFCTYPHTILPLYYRIVCSIPYSYLTFDDIPTLYYPCTSM